MTNSEVNTEKLEQASKTLDQSTSTPASDSVTCTATIAGYQSSAKWGAEQGPVDFQRRYTDYLHYLEHELGAMRDQLAAFVTATADTASSVKRNEEDIETAARNMETKLQTISEDTKDVKTDPRTEASYKVHEDAEATSFREESAPPANTTTGPASSGGYRGAKGPVATAE